MPQGYAIRILELYGYKNKSNEKFSLFKVHSPWFVQGISGI